jgi:hypothetical protein
LPFRIVVLLVVNREGLAWSTPDENARFIGLEQWEDICAPQSCHVAANEWRTIILFEGVSTILVDIDPGADRETLQKESVRQSAGSAEQIDNGATYRLPNRCGACPSTCG